MLLSAHKRRVNGQTRCKGIDLLLLVWSFSVEVAMGYLAQVAGMDCDRIYCMFDALNPVSCWCCPNSESDPFS